MTNRETATAFLQRFCAGDVDGLAPLLAENLQFTGPFYQFSSRDAYLDVLRNDPPEKCGFGVLSVTEGPDSVSIYYDYEKSDGIVTCAQLFKFKDEQISEILLVFSGLTFA